MPTPSHAPHAEIAWTEGQLLAPELFQWNDIRAERRGHESMAMGKVGPWGVLAVRARWDGTAVGIDSCEAVMPSGARISAPAQDAVAPLNVDRSAAGREGVVVLLASPMRDGFGCFCDPEGWSIATRSTRDATSGRLDEYEIPLIRRHLRLVPAGGCPPGWEAIPVLRLRAADPFRPELAIDETFVPPLLAMGGSDEAARLLRTLAVRIRESATSLASDLGDRRLAALGLEGTTALAMQKLCGLNRSLGLLEPLVDRPELHPFEIWKAVRLALAELAIFGKDRFAPVGTAYRHDSFGESLRSLSDSIDAIVRTGIRRPFEPLSLASDAGKLWKADRPDSWEDQARVVLGLRVGEAGLDAARRELLASKVFAAEDVAVEREALAGLRLSPRERDLTGLPPGFVFADLDLATSDRERLEAWRRSRSVAVRLAEARPSSTPTFFIQRSD